MKKILLGILIGGIIFGSLGVYAGVLYSASDIEYTPKDSEWNVDNMQDAVDYLYDNQGLKMDLLWTNPSVTSNFAGGKINIDLTDYNYIVLDGNYNCSNPGLQNKILIEKGSSKSQPVGFIDAIAQFRTVTVTDDGVEFGGQKDYNSNNLTSYGIPYHIWGVK